MSETTTDSNRRYECKIIVPPDRIHLVTMWMRTHRAGFAPIFEPRWINNIYFDTEEKTALREGLEGDSHRMKVRLRWYGELEEIRAAALEFKCRSGSVGRKHAVDVPGSIQLQGQSWRDMIALIRSSLPIDRRIHFEPMNRASLINRYYRAYYASFDRVIRVTVDTQMSSWLQSMHTHINLRSGARLHQHAVLELKASRDHFQALSDAVHGFGIRTSRHSKYITGMLGLNWVR